MAPPAQDGPPPEVTEVASKAIFGIPRYQSIAADLARLQEHRAHVRAARERLRRIDDALLSSIAERRGEGDRALRRWRDGILEASGYREERGDPLDFERRRVYHLLQMTRSLLEGRGAAAFEEREARERIIQARLLLWAYLDQIDEIAWSRSQEEVVNPDDLLGPVRNGARAACEVLDEASSWLVFYGPLGPFTTVFDWFELWDAQLLTIAELSDVAARDEIHLARISPADAQFIRKAPAKKLAGDALGHFGGFLKREWRCNDMLWGRLDAAETICRMLMRSSGCGAGSLERLIRAAQEEVMREERPDLRGDYRGYMENGYRVGEETLADVPMGERSSLVVRAADVTRNMLRRLESGSASGPLRGLFSVLGKALGFALLLLRWPLRAVWGADPAVRRGASLAILFVGLWSVASLALIALGVIGTTSTLWTLIGLGAAIFLIWSALQAFSR